MALYINEISLIKLANSPEGRILILDWLKSNDSKINTNIELRENWDGEVTLIQYVKGEFYSNIVMITEIKNYQNSHLGNLPDPQICINPVSNEIGVNTSRELYNFIFTLPSLIREIKLKKLINNLEI